MSYILVILIEIIKVLCINYLHDNALPLTICDFILYDYRKRLLVNCLR